MTHKKLMKTAGAVYGDCAYIYRNGILVRREESYKDKKVEFLYWSPLSMPIRISTYDKEKVPAFQRIILSGSAATILRIGEIAEIDISPFNGSEASKERGIGCVSTSVHFAQGTELYFHTFSNVPMSTDFTIQGETPFSDCYSREVTGLFVPDYQCTAVETEHGKAA